MIPPFFPDQKKPHSTCFRGTTQFYQYHSKVKGRTVAEFEGRWEKRFAEAKQVEGVCLVSVWIKDHLTILMSDALCSMVERQRKVE